MDTSGFVNASLGTIDVTAVNLIDIGNPGTTGNLTGGIINLMSDNNIQVDANGTINGTGVLTVNADNDITLGGDLTTTGSNIVITADADSNGAGTLIINAGDSVTSGGGVITLLGESVFLNGTVNTGGGNLNTTTDRNGNSIGEFDLGSGASILTAGGDWTATGDNFSFDGAGGGNTFSTVNLGAGAFGITATGLIKVGHGTTEYGVITAGSIDWDTTDNIAINDHASNAITTAGVMDLSANGNLDITNGNLNSGSGALNLTADADTNSVGDLTIESAATVDSNGGNITLYGYNYNQNGSDVISDGGAIDIDADFRITIGTGGSQINSGGGNITMDANTNWINFDSATITSGGGNLTMNSANRLLLDNNSTINLGAGNLAGTATGGRIELGSDITANNVTLTTNDRFELANAPTKTLNLTGVFTINADDNIIMDEADINITATNINLNADADGNGTGNFDVEAGRTLTTNNSNLNTASATASIAGEINAGTGTVQLAASTNAGTIGLGGGAGALNLTDAELDNITADTITIGNANTSGTIDISTIDGLDTNLALNTSGAITDALGNNNDNITLTAGHNFAIDGGAAGNGSGQVGAAGNSALNINTSGGGTISIDTDDAAVFIGSNASDMVITTITSGTGNVNITSGGAVNDAGGGNTITNTGSLTLSSNGAIGDTSAFGVNTGNILITTTNGNDIGLESSAAITLDSIATGGAGNISIAAGSNILDGNGAANNINATGNVVLTAVNNVGALADPLEVITTGNLSVTSSGVNITGGGTNGIDFTGTAGYSTAANSDSSQLRYNYQEALLHILNNRTLRASDYNNIAIFNGNAFLPTSNETSTSRIPGLGFLTRNNDPLEFRNQDISLLINLQKPVPVHSGQSFVEAEGKPLVNNIPVNINTVKYAIVLTTDNKTIRLQEK